jgi:hypothetical protein
MTVLANPPRHAEFLDLKRQAFLLSQLNTSRDEKLSRTDANNGIPKQIQEELALTPPVADDLRTALASRGFLTEQTGKRGALYTITVAGQTWLRENQRYVPLRTTKGKVNSAADPHLAQRRIACLLLQLVDLPDGGQTPTELNKKLGKQQTKLGLNAATARHVRGELAIDERITVFRTARSEKYFLTPAGYSYLVTLSFDDLGKLTMSGSALTQLLRVARNEVASKSVPVPKSTPQPTAVPTPGQLQATVMEIFEALKQKLNTKLVPIHDVRSAVHSQFGAEAASHAVFDEVILALRRKRKIRLISISDRSRATVDQLRDSIVGVGETFFYLESVDGFGSG